MNDPYNITVERITDEDGKLTNAWNMFYTLPISIPYIELDVKFAPTKIYRMRVRIKNKMDQGWYWLTSRKSEPAAWETLDLNEAYQELARKVVWWDHDYEIVEYTGQQP